MIILNKWLKYTIYILFILVIGGGGWGTYTFFIKDYETTDEQVDEIVDSEFEIELPEDTSSNSSSEKGNISEEVSTEKSSKGDSLENPSGPPKDEKDTDSKKKSVQNRDTKKENVKNKNLNTEKNNNETDQLSSNDSKYTSESQGENSTPSKDEKGEKDHTQTKKESNTSEDSTTKRVTAESIKAKYKPSFEALQGQALSKLNVLISYAYNEYKGKKNRGEKVSYGYFYNKYKAAAKKLEAKTDQTFQQLYTSLENELAQNGYSKKEALEIKRYYNQKKEQRENQLLSKVLDKF